MQNEAVNPGEIVVPYSNEDRLVSRGYVNGF